MSRIAWYGLLLTGVGLGMALGTARAGDDSEGEMLKVVVHVNFPEAERQGGGLKNIANVLKASPGAQVEVVCHGPGIVLVEKARGAHAEEVAALIRQGVRFVACENTMRQKSIRKEDLLAGVGTVPSGTVEVIRKQQKDGFAYFKP
jgi:intracellular sulfur oxidation DsrE/DsrF family protein